MSVTDEKSFELSPIDTYYQQIQNRSETIQVELSLLTQNRFVLAKFDQYKLAAEALKKWCDENPTKARSTQLNQCTPDSVTSKIPAVQLESLGAQKKIISEQSIYPEPPLYQSPVWMRNKATISLRKKDLVKKNNNKSIDKEINKTGRYNYGFSKRAKTSYSDTFNNSDDTDKGNTRTNHKTDRKKEDDKNVKHSMYKPIGLKVLGPTDNSTSDFDIPLNKACNIKTKHSDESRVGFLFGDEKMADNFLMNEIDNYMEDDEPGKGKKSTKSPVRCAPLHIPYIPHIIDKDLRSSTSPSKVNKNIAEKNFKLYSTKTNKSVTHGSKDSIHNPMIRVGKFDRYRHNKTFCNSSLDRSVETKSVSFKNYHCVNNLPQFFLICNVNGYMTDYSVKDYGLCTNYGRLSKREVKTIFLMANSNKLLIGDDEGYLQYISIEADHTMTINSNQKIHEKAIHCIVGTYDNRFLFVASKEGFLKQYAVDTDNSHMSYYKNWSKICSTKITSMLIDRDNTYLYTGDSDGTLSQFCIEEQKLVKRFKLDNFSGRNGSITVLYLTNDSKFLFIGYKSGFLRQIDFQNGGFNVKEYGWLDKQVTQLNGPAHSTLKSSIHSVFCTGDYRWMFIGVGEGILLQFCQIKKLIYKDYGRVMSGNIKKIIGGSRFGDLGVIDSKGNMQVIDVKKSVVADSFVVSKNEIAGIVVMGMNECC